MATESISPADKPFDSSRLDDEQAVLVGQAGAVRRYAPSRARPVLWRAAGLVEYANGDVRVADIECKQHDYARRWYPAIIQRAPLRQLETRNQKL